jgi:hypothetical protein
MEIILKLLAAYMDTLAEVVKQHSNVYNHCNWNQPTVYQVVVGCKLNGSSLPSICSACHNNLLDDDNELNMYCSVICKEKEWLI